jgi:hypothetical protein
MRTRQRPLHLAILGALALSAGSVAAGSASTTLTVGVTVVRSCVVATTSIDRGSAQVDLRCTSGAASTVRRATGAEVSSAGAATPLRLHTPTSPYRGAAAGDLFEVATINF